MYSTDEAPPPYPGTENEPNSSSTHYAVKDNVYLQSNTAAPSNSMPYSTISVQYVPVTINFGSDPIQCVCHFCQTPIVTSTKHQSGNLAWLMCLALTCCGVIPCCCIPFCITSCKDTIHRCPQCRTVLGRHRPL